MAKRKSDQPVKKAGGKRTRKEEKNDDALLSVEAIDSLASEVLNSNKYNNIVTLIAQYEPIVRALTEKHDDKIDHLARKLSLSLYQCFQKLLGDKLLVRDPSQEKDEKRQVVAKWVSEKYEQFKKTTLDAMATVLAGPTSFQLDLVDIQLDLIKLENSHFGESLDAYYPSTSYKRLVQSILQSTHGDIMGDGTSSDYILLEFLEKYKKCYDLQYYLWVGLADIEESKESKEVLFSKIYTVLKVPISISEPKELPTWVSGTLPSNAYKPTQFQAHFQKAFLAFLTLPSTLEQHKNILLILHKRVIPFMAQPTRLMDFLTDCYNIKGDEVVPILALNSLYELMRQYNLEYPDFYTKLYSLLTPQLLYTRHRSRFFRLCDLFLSSTHLSVNLVASFIKKLARLAMASTASGVVIVIPFIYNQLKRHPSCMVMVHNPTQKSVKDDPFDVDEKNPLKTNAMASSLWEMEALMSHYHPNISTLARIFSEPFRKPSYNMEDFLDWSYASLMESEGGRKYRGHAALEFEEVSVVGYMDGWKV